jgi:hypothetical protein
VYCEEKNRLMKEHADAVTHYVRLVEKRHDGYDALSEAERSSLAAEIGTARGAIDDRRIALDKHICEHGCSTTAPETCSKVG